jgi:ribosomal protein S6--L-glutamate ligase
MPQGPRGFGGRWLRPTGVPPSPIPCLDATLRAAHLHVGVLVEGRYRAQVQPAGLIVALKRGGHRVRVIDADDTAHEVSGAPWCATLDVVVARGRSQSVLLLLKQAELAGTRTINRRASIAAVRNKAEMTVALAAAGLPIPSTFVGTPQLLTKAVPAELYPLIIKPVYGDNGRGLHVISHPKEWRELEWPEHLALAQRYLPTDGYDLKLYGIGDEVWAVRKPSPLTPEALRGEEADLIPTSDWMRAIGRRCRQLFELDLYGVDCVESEGEPVLIEVNEFPNYSAVPDADERLAAFVGRCLTRASAS